MKINKKCAQLIIQCKILLNFNLSKRVASNTKAVQLGSNRRIALNTDFTNEKHLESEELPILTV